MADLVLLNDKVFTVGGSAGGWHSDEKLSLAEAIENYTLGSAFAEFQKKVKVAVMPGKFVYLLVMEKDLFKISQKDILNAQVELTVLAGKVVF